MLFDNIWLLLAFFFGIFLIAFLLLNVFGRKNQDISWKKTVRSKLEDLESQKLDLSTQVMQLDKILEFALQSKFNKKDTFGNLLKTHKKKFNKEDLNEIWQAHKIRNKIAHDINFVPNQHELRQAVETLKIQSKKISS